MDFSDLKCFTCGSGNNEALIAVCNSCRDCTHVYCMKSICDPLEIQKVFELDWKCEKCVVFQEPTINPKGKRPLNGSNLKRNGSAFEDSLNSLKKQKQSSESLFDKTENLTPSNGKIYNLPFPTASWKGEIEFFYHLIHAHKIEAHLAQNASEKIQEISIEMPQKMHFVKKSRKEVWPKAFKLEPPTHEDIGLFFFSSETDRLKEEFLRMAEQLYRSDQVLMGQVGSLRLLLFPSKLLPENKQCLNGEPYLWAVVVANNNNNKDQSNTGPSRISPQTDVDRVKPKTRSKRKQTAEPIRRSKRLLEKKAEN